MAGLGAVRAAKNAVRVSGRRLMSDTPPPQHSRKFTEAAASGNISMNDFGAKSAIPHYSVDAKSASYVTLNHRVRSLDMSPTVGINELSNKLLSEGRQVYKCGLGQSPFPVPDFMVQALRDNARRKDYLPVRGMQELREAIATRQSERLGCDFSADDVLIGPGSKELIFTLQLGCYSELLLPRGSWVSYGPQAKIVGRPLHWIDTNFESKWKIDPELLLWTLQEDPTRPRILILNYPSNPHGQTYTADELKELADVARRFSLVVLSDEIYAPVDHGRGNHESLAKYYPEGTIILDGISKWAGAGGWRCGSFTFPKEMRWLSDAMSSIASETYTCVSAPTQAAAVPAFEDFHGAEMQQYLRDSNRTMRGLAVRATKALRRAEGARVHEPDGGFYIFPDFTHCEKIHRLGIRDSQQMCSKLMLETGVASLPGRFFGVPPVYMTTRLAFVDFKGESILRALAAEPDVHPESERMTELLMEHCPNAVKPFEIIADFINS